MVYYDLEISKSAYEIEEMQKCSFYVSMSREVHHDRFRGKRLYMSLCQSVSLLVRNHFWPIKIHAAMYKTNFLMATNAPPALLAAGSKTIATHSYSHRHSLSNRTDKTEYLHVKHILFVFVTYLSRYL